MQVLVVRNSFAYPTLRLRLDCPMASDFGQLLGLAVVMVRPQNAPTWFATIEQLRSWPLAGTVRTPSAAEETLMAEKKAPNPIDKHVGSRVRMRRMMLSMSQ